MDRFINERSKGVGKLLIDASKEYGKRGGADFIRTEVFPQNIDGMRFYERNGFVEMMETIECQLGWITYPTTKFPFCGGLRKSAVGIWMVCSMRPEPLYATI